MKKAIVVVTDSEAMTAFERALFESGVGFTVVPRIIGSGRTGLKTGDRVHPGASSLLFTFVPADKWTAVQALLRRVRDEAGVAEATRFFVFDAEEFG
ncbi:MAG: hypothetical protein LJF15_05055 [Acidobacteria bacterium]|jgi:hypothetical protein|nr:hypothetical protein [Acidobacteriota bacterium]